MSKGEEFCLSLSKGFLILDAYKDDKIHFQKQMNLFVEKALKRNGFQRMFMGLVLLAFLGSLSENKAFLKLSTPV